VAMLGTKGAGDVIDRPRGAKYSTVGRRLGGLSLGLLAALVFLVGLVELFYASLFAHGEEQAPTTTGQRLPWLLLPILVICVSGWLLREAYRYPTAAWSPQRYFLGFVAATLSAAAWWALVGLLRG
jgi:hypothetical protein